jgi:primosomal replication protein N
MSFKHKFPNSVILIGYLEGVSKIGTTKNSGMKITAKLYNPSEQYRKYDLRIPLMALGKPAKLVEQLAKSGDLVSVIGRMAMVSTGSGLNLYVLADYIKSLDEDSTYEMDSYN